MSGPLCRPLVRYPAIALTASPAITPTATVKPASLLQPSIKPLSTA